jgi:preprotein translocase subunit Sec61beta
MANEGGISMPGVFGGLMRYDEEYTSRFMVSPQSVLIGIGVVVAGVLALKVFFPIG